MADILLLTIPALTDAELRNAITDTEVVLGEPLTDDEREVECERLRRLRADGRRRGLLL